MAIFKCKMCGGDIQAEAGAAFGACDSCGTTSTLPKANEERIVNLFNRANHFRRLNEFDKALVTYESILTEDSANAEAHWCVVLCRYGIEYVEDPVSRERVPTCHRVQYESILADADYLAALENAPDSYTRSLYETEAKKIAEIQRGILAIAGQEEPFDIFICYKETTDGGSRTKDSTLAQDIYYQLTNDGYKVFFSRITLEDRLGRDYEPFIFSALNSAKVMLVIGTKKEYFEAVWVKNEWSRFIALMKNDRSRLLIPCYRDMDAYDLPDELAHLQSQDMGKIGFIQDLVRGVKKVLDADKAPKAMEMTVASAAGGTGADTLFKRVLIFLEDGDFKQADEYCERILDTDPENARAYVGKLLAHYKLAREELLGDCPEEFDKSTLYQKALRFADERYKNVLAGYAETGRKKKLLKEATDKSKNVSELNDAVKILEQIKGYENADELLEKCEKELDEAYSWALGHMKNGDYKKALNWFKQIIGYRDASAQAGQAKKLLQQSETYSQAEESMKYHRYKDAYDLFKKIEDYRDASEKAKQANNFIEESYQNAIRAEARRKKMTALSVAGALIVVSTIIAILIIVNIVIPSINYNNAIAMFERGDFRDAELAFRDLGDFRDAEARVIQSREAEEEEERLRVEREAEERLREEEERLRRAREAEEERLREGVAGLAEARETVSQSMRLISAMSIRTVGIQADGTIIETVYNELNRLGLGNLGERGRDLIAISYTSGAGNTLVGLRADGTVVHLGSISYTGQLNVSEWQDIVAVSAQDGFTVGLRADGTVVAVGWNDYGQLNVSGWRDIVAISAGGSRNGFTVGLRADGTVVAVGHNSHGQLDVGEWRDIVAVSASHSHTVGLRADGTVVAVGWSSDGQLDVGDWRDIIAICTGPHNTVGLRADGTVVAVGGNRYGQRDVSGWRDIVAISAGIRHTVGLRADGTVVAVGNNHFGQLDVGDWRLFD